MVVNQIAKIKGKWTVVSIVENLGDETEETETPLDAAHDTVTVGADEETISADDEFGVEITERDVISSEPFISTPAFIDPDLEVFEAAGVIDENGEYTLTDRHVEAVRIRAYESAEFDGVEPVMVVEGSDIVPTWDDDAEASADDFWSAGIQWEVNGGLKMLNAENAQMSEYTLTGE